MKKVLRLMAMASVLICLAQALTAKGSEYLADADDQLYGIENVSFIGRSYHGATYDAVTGKEDHPFMFTSSMLGRAMRASSFLLGYLYVAAEDVHIREQLLDDAADFGTKILNFYVLCFEAQRFVRRHLDEEHEKTHYLLEELDQLRTRVLLLAENFEALTEDDLNPAIITVRFVLATIAKQTGQILAV